MRYIIWPKKDAEPSDILEWKEKFKNTLGVTVLGPVQSDVLIIDVGSDVINLLRDQFGGVCNFAEDIQFDI